MPDRPHQPPSQPHASAPVAFPANPTQRPQPFNPPTVGFVTDRELSGELPRELHPSTTAATSPSDRYAHSAGYAHSADRASWTHPPRPTPGWQLWCKNLSLMTTGGVLFIIAFGLIGMWQSGGQLLHHLRQALTLTTAPAQVDIRSIVVQQVRGASELTTAVYSMESVVPTSRERTLGSYVIGKTTLLYIAHGEVRAGVDLSTLQPQNIQVNGDQIALVLPPAKILDSKIDVNRSKVYDYDRGFLGLGPDVAPELQVLAQQETLAKIVQTACNDGILQSATDRAQLVVSQLLSTAGYPQIQITTQSPGTESCAATVSPATVSPATVSPAAIPPATVSPASVSPASVSPATVSPAAIPPAATSPLPDSSSAPIPVPLPEASPLPSLPVVPLPNSAAL
ncbi:MAG: DUF4230 domain-containing protein [Elainella sp. Prado103]|nr:DUF4230 domain-containing protein [Elainella sp. Prado103]